MLISTVSTKLIPTVSKKPISTWTEENIKSWALLVKFWKTLDGSKPQDIVEALAIAKRAFYLNSTYNLTDVQILSCLKALIQDRENDGGGILFQVATGSGKSAIIGIISTIYCLLGHKIDIYTSSPVLAERDSKEWSKFYSMFSLTSDHNGDKSDTYISGEKTCYKRDIVYGDCSQFQFDFLRDAYSDLNTRAGRDFSKSLAIIDEVDAMLIDDSSKLARLSSTVPGTDLLQLIYFLIWDRLTFIKQHLFGIGGSVYYMEGTLSPSGKGNSISYTYAEANNSGKLVKLDNIAAHIIATNAQDLEKARIYLVEQELDTWIETHLINYAKSLISTDSKIIQLPKHLQYFATSQIPNWISSALTALSFTQNIHYVVHENKIKPVDFSTTGIIHSSTNWNNGLHQFLQIKHELKMDTESVTTNFLSNVAIIRKYGSNVIGFTGTLGSKVGQECLKSVYNVQLYKLPETHFKRYIRFPDISTSNDREWLEEILRSTMQETSKRRGVLIICETIQKAELIRGALAQLKLHVKSYTSNQENQEKQIERIHPGDVIVATNLAGRGTDIKTTDIENHGGLHVILTFLPMSLRIEEQGFGRTSRQGKKGTGQLIVVKQNQKLRDLEEEQNLTTFQTEKFPLMTMKDKMFNEFLQLYQNIRHEIRENMKSNFERTLGLVINIKSRPSVEEILCLQAIEEKWATFLTRLDNEIQLEEAEKKFNEFKMELLDTWKSKTEIKDKISAMITYSENCYYFIQLGNFKLKRSNGTDELKESIKYFENSISVDKNFATAGYVGKGFGLLKGKIGDNFNNYKENAVENLSKGRELLYDEISKINIMQNMIQRHGHSQGFSSPLGQQLVQKSNLVGSYLKTIEGAISVTEKSLRHVYFTKITNDQKRQELQKLPNSTVEQNPRNLPLILKTGTKTCHLEFHDLTSKYDMGTDDQIIQTLSPHKSRITSDKCQVYLQINSNLDLEILASDKAVNFNKLKSENIRFEIGSIDVDPETGDLGLDISKLPENIKSCCVKINGIPGTKVNKILSLVREKLGKSRHIAIKVSGTESAGSNLIFTDTILEIQESTLYDKIPQMSLLIENLPDIRTIQDLVKIVVTKSEVKIDKVSISFQSDPKFLLNSWNDYIKTNFSELKLQFENISIKEAEAIVPALRKQTNDITLQFKNISVDTANLIFEKAILKQEDIILAESKELNSYFMNDCMPFMELRDLSARGICLVITFNERKFVPWCTVVTMIGIASVQAAAGTVLICTGFGATVGMSLITEGMSDLITAQRIYSTREFSWTSYATQKAVSLTISAASMGLSTLKDGAKGASLLVEKAATEVGEQAATKVLVNGKTVAAGFQIVSTNLKSLAVKQLAVSIGETGLRIGLTAIGNSIADFCFDQVKEQLNEKVGEALTYKFGEKDYKKLISYYMAINKEQLKIKIDTIVQSTMNPKAGSGWTQIWNNVGLPLTQGILSSPQFFGSTLTRMAMIYGAIKGAQEITVAVNNLTMEIFRILTEQKPKTSTILQSYCKISKVKAKELEEALVFKKEFELDQNSLKKAELTGPEEKIIKQTFQNLFKVQNDFKIEKDIDFSQIRKSISDAITNHIIRIANSHIVSPAMSVGVGGLVAKLSEELQDRFLVSESQNTDEQNQIQKKVDELKSKENRTKEDDEYLKMYDTKNTFRNQINFTAKEFIVAYNKKKILANAAEAGAKQRENENKEKANAEGKAESKEAEIAKPESKDNQEKASKSQPQEQLEPIIENILNNGPTDMAGMISLAEANGKNIKIVDNPDYKPTQDEIDKGVKIVLYEKPTNGSKIGHFSILGSTPSNTRSNNPMDCGYEVISQLTGKTVEELRVQMATIYLSDPDAVRQIQHCTNFLIHRYPQQSSEFLMTSGLRQSSNADPIDPALGRMMSELDQLEPNSEKRNEKIKEIIEHRFASSRRVADRAERLTENELIRGTAGFIYVLEIVESPFLSEEDRKNIVKVGLGIDVRKRQSILQGRNGEKYKVIAAIPTTCLYSSENLAHRILEPYNVHRNRTEIPDGNTEFFNVSPDLAQAAAERACQEIKNCAEYFDVFTYPKHDELW